MLALSLLPIAALFMATARAATFGKNIVPFLPMVRQFHPLVSIPWAVLINLLVVFF